MREPGRVFALAAVAGLVVGLASAVVAQVTGHSVRPWLACVLAVSAALLLAATHESWTRVFGGEPLAPARPEAPVLTDRKRGGLDLTVRMIDRAMTDVDRFDMLRVRLLRLADGRLRTHGIDLRAEPDRARALVGDSLVALLAGRPDRVPRRSELAEWIQRLEAL